MYCAKFSAIIMDIFINYTHMQLIIYTHNSYNSLCNNPQYNMIDFPDSKEEMRHFYSFEGICGCDIYMENPA